MRSRDYRKHVAAHPCLVCGNPETQAHHLLRAASRGMGMKTGDEWCIPLCFPHHNQLHESGDEIGYFLSIGCNYSEIKQWAIDSYRQWSFKLKPIKKPGRPWKYGDKIKTEAMRVPAFMKKEIKALIKQRLGDKK